jgi:misacylated tRNA(Ala) deacylase
MKALYLEDSYLKEFDAKVESVSDGKFVVLDSTCFYPASGGQPHDTGKLIRKSDNKEFKVLFTGKFESNISHQIEPENELKEGDEVHGVINWERRYKLMRAHTATHIVSSLIHDKAGAKITGNQIALDKIRVDYELEEFDKQKFIEYIEQANQILKQDHKVTISYLSREEAEKDPDLAKLAMGLPPGLKELRIISIGEVDRQADGGTHAHSTKEVGDIEFIKCDNKGKKNRRVYYRLVD